MLATSKLQKQKLPDKKGKYTSPDSLIEGGVNELCPLAAPHAIANYCNAANIPYPAELTRGKRTEHKAGPTQGAASQQTMSQTPKTKEPPQNPKPPKKDARGGKHSKAAIQATPATPQRTATGQRPPLDPPQQQQQTPGPSQGSPQTQPQQSPARKGAHWLCQGLLI